MSSEYFFSQESKRGLPMSCEPNILLQARNLVKSYSMRPSPYRHLLRMLLGVSSSPKADFIALNGIDLDVKCGECVGVIGKNGAGKSTLLGILSGALSPTSGSVVQRGRVCSLLELGFGFNMDFTGRENIEIVALMYGLSREEIKRRQQQIIDFADIGTFIDQPVKKYSSGMFVRLAFAIIAHVDAEIMLIDEALAVGDVFFQQKCYKFLEEKKAASAMLLVSHDLNAVAALCNRVLVLDHGNIVFAGTPKNAIEHYTHLLYNTPAVEKITGFSPVAGLEPVDEKHKAGEHGQFSGVGLSSSVLSAGDVLKITAQVHLKKACPHPIIGYFFNDRFGKRIFGNCMALEKEISGETFSFSFELVWPDIAPGEYTLTLGVGSGFDVMAQTVYCWVTDFCAVTSVKEKGIVHGMFNVEMNNFTYEGS